MTTIQIRQEPLEYCESCEEPASDTRAAVVDGVVISDYLCGECADLLMSEKHAEYRSRLLADATA